MFMKTSPFKVTKQNLSPEAAKAKHNRDVAAAKTPLRRKRKKENQARGQRSDSDLHHTKSGLLKRASIKNNRGNYGKGTKNE